MSSISDSSPTGHTITDPATRAGDPFAYAGDKHHGCYDGWVYMGVAELVEDEGGDEQIDRVPCRRCADDEGL